MDVQTFILQNIRIPIRHTYILYIDNLHNASSENHIFYCYCKRFFKLLLWHCRIFFAIGFIVDIKIWCPCIMYDFYSVKLIDGADYNLLYFWDKKKLIWILILLFYSLYNNLNALDQVSSVYYANMFLQNLLFIIKAEFFC